MNQYLLFIVFCFSVQGQTEVTSPTDPTHPGNQTNYLNYERIEERFLGRESVLYLPRGENLPKASVIVFGHGQALGESVYNETFMHLAKKGVALIFPKYDNGFFDQNWRRMAADYNEITHQFLQKYQDVLDSSKILYSGHSKGGYVGLMAAGAPNAPQVGALTLFAPAGYDEDYLQGLNGTAALTLVWGEADSIIDREAVYEIYQKSNLAYKQMITVKSYTNRQADHYFVQNKGTFFGGVDGVSPFHFYGSWKWLLGAARDLDQGGMITNSYVYGDKTATTGDSSFSHDVERSWSPWSR